MPMGSVQVFYLFCDARYHSVFCLGFSCDISLLGAVCVAKRLYGSGQRK